MSDAAPMVDDCCRRQDVLIPVTWVMADRPIEAPNSGYELPPSDQGIEGYRPLPPLGTPE